MFKNIKFIFILILFYQTPIQSKSNSFENFHSKDFSNYFSGIVAFENKNNSKALEFFQSSKILLNEHDNFLQRYIYSLVLEKKTSEAIKIIKKNKDKINLNFFDAYLLLIIDSLKKNNFDEANNYLKEISNINLQDRFSLAILESLKQYIFTFKEKKF